MKKIFLLVSLIMFCPLTNGQTKQDPLFLLDLNGLGLTGPEISLSDIANAMREYCNVNGCNAEEESLLNIFNSVSGQEANLDIVTVSEAEKKIKKLLRCEFPHIFMPFLITAGVIVGLPVFIHKKWDNIQKKWGNIKVFKVARVRVPVSVPVLVIGGAGVIIFSTWEVLFATLEACDALDILKRYGY